MIKQLTKNILSLGIVSLFAFSCSQSKEIKPTYIDGETASTNSPSGANGSTIMASNPGAVLNGQQISAPMGGAAINNPEHGKPGHRCDIAVGAPLNSPAASGTPSTQAMTVPASATSQPMQKVASGMNPAHGEPNHRCDIAVGAPLNSPSTQTQNVPQTATPVSKPVSAVANPMNLAINPAHGEPGHSCAIAVGASF